MPKKNWTGHVTKTSHAMDLPKGLFAKSSIEIAQGLKKAVLASSRTKSTKYSSAMSMLTFYINRAGKSLSTEDKERLEQAKVELRKLFGREPKIKEGKLQ